MNKRIAKKRAALAVCVGMDCPMMLNHAKPSFWRLASGKERAHHLAHEMRDVFRVPTAIAHRAARLYLGER